jgi:hypothetical protein
MLVPTAGPFFTRLPLEAAFKYQDRKRYISSRRYVAPSFNDVRLVLNSAQVMAVTNGALQLATFDGDVTLYDDGESLDPANPVIPRILGNVHPLEKLTYCCDVAAWSLTLATLLQISCRRTSRWAS